MQSGYGVSEFQQFLVDGCSSLLSMSTDISNNPQSQKHHQHHLHQQQQPHRFTQLLQNPITQQFFQHPLHFQLLQQQQEGRLPHHLGLNQESGPENSKSPSRVVGDGGGLPFFISNCRPADTVSGSQEALNDDNPMLAGGVDGGSEDRVVGSSHLRWQQPRQEDIAIKEPFWKPLDVQYINRNNKRCKEMMEFSNKPFKKGDEGNENEEGKNSDSNYGLFGELEAIYTHGSGSGSGIGGGNNQTGSGSALTGDNPLPAVKPTRQASDNHGYVDHGSETSTGEEASLKKIQKSRRKKKRRQLGSIATFFESLVKQLMDHQETLHRKFLEVMEKRDEERSRREEAWRWQEMEKSNRDSIARAHEQALASSREAAIVAFLEKVTGESINLPTKTLFNFQTKVHEEEEENPIQQTESFNVNSEINDTTIYNNDDIAINHNANSRRWPKAEVHALIRVRSSLESRFQEPGLKGPLWEEVSSSMAAIGYQRSSKRCKEKWENINKYFRKTKDCAKKRSQHSKTCPYFHQLDQLYSKSINPSPKPSILPDLTLPKDNSELLDAIVDATDQNPPPAFLPGPLGTRQTSNLIEIGSQRLDFNGNAHANVKDDGINKAGNEYDNGDGDDDDDGDEEEEEDEEEEDEEGEGGSQEHRQMKGIERVQGEKELPKEPLYFCLES